MRNLFRRATPRYALIQGLYWAIYCLMVSFASAFLLDKGFTNGQIGLVLGLSYLFSSFLPPAVMADSETPRLLSASVAERTASFASAS